MKSVSFLIAASVLAMFSAPASAYDDNACQSEAIVTRADVTTSYGSAYTVETWYRSPHEAVARFVNDAPSTMAVEGPLVWTRSGEGAAPGDEAAHRFVIGHQFHALALRFDDFIVDVVDAGEEERDGSVFSVRQGTYPGGGTARLLSDADGRASMLVLDLPEDGRIEVDYGDWRQADGLPQAVTILHDGRTFDYSYTDIEIGMADAVDFHEAWPAPALDDVQVHRLHRALLAAHCRGDAGLMGSLSAPQVTVAGRGAVTRTTPTEMEERFSGVFDRLDYQAYTDLQAPAVEVAQSGDLGWAIVNVLAQGEGRETGEPFADEWAWVMLARKIDGVWRHAGNASNLKTD